MTQAEDEETVRRMQANDGVRRAEWGHRGLTFFRGQRPVGTLYFRVGPQGPAAGFTGSPEQERYRDACRAWVTAGVLPDGLAHPEASSREAVARVQGPTVTCAYCGRRFTPTCEVPVGFGSFEEALHVAEMTAKMLNDGLPVECGQCR
jgi:hypothetical protein